MNRKLAGLLFMSMVLISVGIELVLGLTPLRDSLSVTALMVLSELILIVPGLVFAFLCRDSFKESFALRGIRISTVLLCVLMTWLILPLTASLNLFTMLFTDNRAAEIFESLSPAGMGVMALFVAIVAPICEELMFRGILYKGFRANGSALQAIFWTALLFGLFHMNLNQMMYAMALGLFFGMLREVTGSILPSMIGHITVNGGSALVLLLGSETLTETEILEAAEDTSEILPPDMMLQALGVIIPIAAVGVVLALGVLIYIAKRQRAILRLEGIWGGRQSERGRVVGIPLVIGCVICVAYIVLLLILQ